MKKALLSITVLVTLLFCTIAVVDAQTAPEVVRKSFDVRPGGWLTLNSQLGTIDVKTANRNRVNIVYTKSAKAALDRLTQEAFADFDVTFKQMGADVHIEGKFKREWEYWLKRLHLLKLHLLTIRFEVTIPHRCHVDLKTGFGADIQVENIGGAVKAETYGGDLRFGVIRETVWGKTAGGGNITLKECQGKVNLETYGGDIEIGNIAGDVKAKTAGGGKITLKRGQGKVNVETYGGDIEIGNVTEDVKAETAGSGNIQIGNVNGTVEAETYGGDLDFGIVKGAVWGKTAGGGNITLKECQGKVNVETYGGDIEIGNVTEDVKAETAGSGNIQIGNVNGTVEAETYGGDLDFGIVKGAVWGKTAGGGNITLKGCQGKVNVETYGGDIRAEMKKQPRHQWTLETSGSGEIVATLISRIAIDVDAYAGSGRISSDFSVQGSRSKNSLKGIINGGGPLLELRTSSGDIRLLRK